ncbi:Protein of unknown function [Gryllus bimaculatus]|nr:Protein of unknown function [Gryllus bimaculatus]
MVVPQKAKIITRNIPFHAHAFTRKNKERFSFRVGRGQDSVVLIFSMNIFQSRQPPRLVDGQTERTRSSEFQYIFRFNVNIMRHVLVDLSKMTYTVHTPQTRALTEERKSTTKEEYVLLRIEKQDTIININTF